ncbi:hypothetical protein DFH28DRAFT_963559 [Melampsora americana]|nr:hypothetical protein DFH28DRAFT_963559 [Melampsora americana]
MSIQNGFVGAHVAKAFLDHGWNVLGSVRSAQKGRDLLDRVEFSKAAEENRIRYTIIEDLTTSDFTQALEGVDALAHTASPFHLNGKSFSEYAIPAITGTSNVLNAAKKCSKIKAVVVTSSVAAVLNFNPQEKRSEKTYTEEDWLPVSYDEAEAQNNPSVWYCASKKYAEKKAWEIKESGASWSLATICPPMIFGPIVHTSDLDSLNESSGRLYQLLSGKVDHVPPTSAPVFADVRDVAEAHVQAIIKQSTGRFLICSGAFDNQRIADLIHESFPDASSRTPRGKPGEYCPPEQVYQIDSSKAINNFNLKLKTFEKTFGDTIAQYLEIEENSKTSAISCQKISI